MSSHADECPCDDLTQWNGCDLSGNARKWAGAWWYHKAGLRELVGYDLAAGELNVAEVQRVPPEWMEGGDWVLVRLACGYTRPLVLDSLDLAVAAELAFSLWIRRRDAHPYNRAYVDGVPMFFDFSNALGGELELNRDLDNFLSRTCSNGVERWRLEQVSPGVTVTTKMARERYRDQQGGVHMVESLDGFLRAFDEWVARYTTRDLSDLEVRMTGVMPADKIDETADLLRTAQAELPDAARCARASLVESYLPIG